MFWRGACGGRRRRRRGARRAASHVIGTRFSERDNSPETAKRRVGRTRRVTMSCMFNEIVHVLWASVVSTGDWEGLGWEGRRIGIARAVGALPTGSAGGLLIRSAAAVSFPCFLAHQQGVTRSCSLTAWRRQLDRRILARLEARRTEAPTGGRWWAANLKLTPRRLTHLPKTVIGAITRSP